MFSKNVTPREKEVLILISSEFTTGEIAVQLSLSRHTVMSHRKNLLQKLNVRNVAGLIRRGFEVGLLTV